MKRLDSEAGATGFRPNAPSTLSTAGGPSRRTGRLAALALGLALVMGGCASTDRFAGLDGEGLYRVGLAAFEEGDWENAITGFERHLSSAPGHPLNPDARFFMAQAHAERGEFISAAAEFELFLQFYPSHGMAPEASLGICRAYADLSPIPQRHQEFTELAVQACADTTRQFQGLNIAREADDIRLRMVERLAQSRFEQAQFYRRRGGIDSAILYFEEVVRLYPETQWAPRAILEIFRAYRELDWDEEAEDEAQRLLTRYPDSDAADVVREERGSDPFLGL